MSINVVTKQGKFTKTSHSVKNSGNSIYEKITPSGKTYYIKGSNASKMVKILIKTFKNSVFKNTNTSLLPASTSTPKAKSKTPSPKVKSPKAKSSTATPKVPSPKSIKVTSLIPVIVPGPEQVLAKTSEYTKRLEQITQKLKNLTNSPTNNNKMVNAHCLNKAGIVNFDRTLLITFKYSSIHGDWQHSFEKPIFEFKELKQAISYNFYWAKQQLLLSYGKNIKSFEDVRMSDIVDTKWFIAQDAYIRSLSSRKILTLLGYIRYGGMQIVNDYLGGTLTLAQFKNFSSEISLCPFYFQAHEFYKYPKETPRFIVLRRIKDEYDIRSAKYILNMFINEINSIIRKSPAVTKEFIVFRGTENDKLLQGSVNKSYTSQRFTAVSTVPMKCKKVLKRITLLRGSRCLMVFGFGTYGVGMLLPRGATYKITSIRKNASSLKFGQLCNPAVAYETENLVDVLLYGSVEEPESIKVKH